ncbi:MAG: hypothetical protein IPL79_08800 [Myxococcales bacterium]|nr:hypothetical protein [Myxococcales bacterium]
MRKSIGVNSQVVASSKPYEGQPALALDGEPDVAMGEVAQLPAIEREALAARLQRREIEEVALERSAKERFAVQMLEAVVEIEDVRGDQLDPPLAQPKPHSFDIANAVNRLNANAKAESLGRCGTYVRLALQAGGVDVSGHPVAGANYGPFLLARDFVRISGDDFVAGDIAVMRAFRGRRKNHPYGHVQMFNGEQWVSDFRQCNFWPGPDYRESQPPYAVYRFPHG